MLSLYPRFEKVGVILVYICPWFHLSFGLSFRHSVTLFRQRYLHNRLREKLHIWYTGPQRQVVSWDCKWAFSYLFFLVFVPFSFFPNFSSKISPQPFKIETSYLVYRSTTTSCIVGLQMGFLLFVLPFVCSFFFLSKIFIKDISTTVKARNFIFSIQVHNHKLYRGIENGLSPVCSSLCFFFLLFRFFVKDISTTV